MCRTVLADLLVDVRESLRRDVVALGFGEELPDDVIQLDTRQASAHKI